MFVMFTVCGVATFLLANAPVAEQVTMSGENTPEGNEQCSVAVVVPSYGLASAVTVAVTGAGVMSAVVVPTESRI
jgi:hypothetical protein